MSLKKQAISGMLWTFAQQFSTQGITFVVSIILARLLLPSEFGLIAMIGVFIALGNALINSGLTQSLIRTENPDEDDFSTVFFFNLIGSIIIYIIIFFLAPYISLFYHQVLLTAIIRIYAVVFIIDAFAAVQLTRLTKRLDFKTQMKVAVPSLIVSSTVGIYMALQGYGVWSLVVAAIVKSTVNSIQLWFWTKWRPLLRIKIDKLRFHFNYGVKLMLSSVLDIIFTNAYTIIIGKFFLPAQVGFYNRANTLKQLPVSNIAAMVDKVAFPLFAEMQNDDIRLKKAYKNVMQMVIFLVSPILIFMAFLAEPLFRFLFTEKWLPAVPYFQILCANGVLYPIHSYNLIILKVKGRSDLFLKLEIIKKIAFVIIVLISFQYGIYGLLYGGVIASVLSFFINTHYSGKFLNYPAFAQARDIVPLVFLAISAGLGAYGVDYLLKAIDALDFIRLLSGGLTGVIIYVALSFVLKVNSLTEIKNIILKK